MRAVIILAALTAACSAKSAGAAKPPPPKEIEVLTLAPTEARVTGEYLGSLLSRASVTVLPQVAGYVRKLHVKPGQAVAVGDVIAEVDARVESAQLASASADVASASAKLSLAAQQRARAEALFKEGLATAQEVDQRRADEVAAQAAVRAAKAQVAQRQVELGYNVVRAAVPGTIGDVQVRLGDYVTATSKLTTINGAGGLELTVAVPAPRARALAPGAPIELLGDDGSVLATSTVFYVAPEVDARTQLVPVKASVPASTGFRTSELVRARVIYSVGSALQAPALAVVRQSGQAFLFVVADKDGKQVVERRAVELGPLSAQGYVLSKGVAAGDRIAVSSIQALRDGAAVTIKQPKPAAPPPAAPAPPASH